MGFALTVTRSSCESTPNYAGENLQSSASTNLNTRTRIILPLAVLKQDRISLWHEQTARYASELRELKQQMVAQLENLDKEKEVLRGSLDSVGTRVDRVERELDYLETQNGAQPCVDVDDKLIEQQVTLVKEKQKQKYLKQSGEVTFFHSQVVKKNNKSNKKQSVFLIAPKTFMVSLN